MAGEAGEARFVGRSDMSDVFRDMDRLKADAETLKTSFGQGLATGIDQAGRSMQRVGTVASASVTAPLVLGFKRAVDTFTTFDEKATQTQLVLNTTAEQSEALRQKAIELGASFGRFSAQDAVEGMYELASAGLTVDQTMEAIKPTLELAEAATIGVGEAAEVSAGVMNAFGLEATDLGHINDVLAAALQVSTFHGEEFAQALAHAGQLGATANQDFESVAAGLALIRNQGVPAAQAGTALRQVFDNLKGPTKQARKLMTDLGQEFRNADGTMRQFPEIVGEINRTLNDSNPAFAEMREEMGLGEVAARDHALNVLFGTEAMKAMGLALNSTLTLVNDNAEGTAALAALYGEEYVQGLEAGEEVTLDAANAVQGLSDQFRNTEGLAETFAGTMSQTLAAAIANTGGAFESLQIAVVSTLEPALKGFLFDTLIPLIDKITQFATENPEVVTQLAKIAGVAALVGPALIVVGTAFRTVAFFLKPIFTLLSPIIALFRGFAGVLGVLRVAVLANPIGLLVAAIAALIAFSPELRQLVFGLLGALAQILGELARAIIPVLQGVIEALLPVVLQVAQLFSSVVQAVLPLIPILVSALIPILEIAIGVIGTLVQAIAPLLITLVEGLAPILVLIAEIIASVAVPVLSALIGVVGTLLEAILPIVEILLQALAPVLALVAQIISGALGPVLESLITIVAAVLTPVLQVLAEVFEFLLIPIQAITDALGFFADIAGGVAGFVTDVFGGIGDFFGDVFGGAANEVSGAADRIETDAGRMGESFGFVQQQAATSFSPEAAKFGSQVSQETSTATSALSGFATTAGGLFGQVGQGAQGMAESVGGAFSTLDLDLQGATTSLGGFATGALEGLGGFEEQIGGFTTGALDSLNLFESETDAAAGAVAEDMGSISEAFGIPAEAATGLAAGVAVSTDSIQTDMGEVQLKSGEMSEAMQIAFEQIGTTSGIVFEDGSIDMQAFRNALQQTANQTGQSMDEVDVSLKSVGSTLSTVAGQFDSFASRVTSAMQRAASNVASSASSIRASTIRISPHTRESPSLVEQVDSGVDEIMKSFGRLESFDTGRVAIEVDMMQRLVGSNPITPVTQPDFPAIDMRDVGDGPRGGNTYQVFNPRSEETEESLRQIATRTTYLGADGNDDDALTRSGADRAGRPI